MNVRSIFLVESVYFSLLPQKKINPLMIIPLKCRDLILKSNQSIIQFISWWCLYNKVRCSDVRRQAAVNVKAMAGGTGCRPVTSVTLIQSATSLSLKLSYLAHTYRRSTNRSMVEATRFRRSIVAGHYYSRHTVRCYRLCWNNTTLAAEEQDLYLAYITRLSI